MARKLDPTIAEILKRYGFGPDAAWDCHGVWVVYHRVLEQIAAKTRIRFDAPVIVEANGAAGVAAVCVAGHLEDISEWSIGEASPKNNKNAYPWAMAEKRAKDRVILKLIGLHGLAYSEDEADDFKAPPQQPPAPPLGTPRQQQQAIHEPIRSTVFLSYQTAIELAATEQDLNDWHLKHADEIEHNLSEEERAALRPVFANQLRKVRGRKAA